MSFYTAKQDTELLPLDLKQSPPPRKRGFSVHRLRRRIAAIVCSVLAVVVFFFSFFPVYWMVRTSFMNASDAISPDLQFYPHEPTIQPYISVITGESAKASNTAQFLPALGMSLGTTMLTLVFCLLFALLASIAVSRMRFKGRKEFIIILLIVQMVPSEAMMYTIFGVIDGWGLTSSILGLTIVYVAAVLPFTVWMLRGFVGGVPESLEEAAMIDGCSRVGAFMRITFPLLAPGLVATGIFAYIQSWNEFTMANLIMSRIESYTLQPWLQTFQKATGATDWSAIMAGSTLVAIPVMIFFLIVQGKMTGGLVSGAVKG